MKRIEVKDTVRLKVYPLIVQAVETGVNRGWTRAHKHTNKPGEEAIRDTIAEAVIGELCELLDFAVGYE